MGHETRVTHKYTLTTGHDIDIGIDTDTHCKLT